MHRDSWPQLCISDFLSWTGFKVFHLSELQSCLRLTKVLLSFVTNQKKKPKKGPKMSQKGDQNDHEIQENHITCHI